MIAGTPEAILTARQALGPGFSYRLAYGVEDAISMLSPELDVILCNVAFDSSRMFDFIRAARSSDLPRVIPIICFRQRPLTTVTHHALELSLHEFERTSFIDLHALSKEAGITAALSTFRQAVSAEISRSPAH